MSILTAQPSGIVVVVHAAGDRVHHVKMFRRADVDAVVLESDGDVMLVKVYTVQNRQTILRFELPGSSLEGDNAWRDVEERRQRRNALAEAVMRSIVAEDADVVWTNNRGWTRVPDVRTR